MEDQDFIDSEMDGKPYRAARLAATLRRQLWREHLGLLPAQDMDATGDPNARAPDVCLNHILEDTHNEFVKDPLSDAVWNTWTGQATTNTETYRMLFRADPDDNIKTFDDYDNFRPRGSHREGHLFDPYLPIKEVREKLDRIKGHLVWLPLHFLEQAEMAEPGLAVNQITEVRVSPFVHADGREPICFPGGLADVQQPDSMLTLPPFFDAEHLYLNLAFHEGHTDQIFPFNWEIHSAHTFLPLYISYIAHFNSAKPRATISIHLRIWPRGGKVRDGPVTALSPFLFKSHRSTVLVIVVMLSCPWRRPLRF